jgi:Regulator of chromosome condensation (RCC1) repeat
MSNSVSHLRTASLLGAALLLTCAAAWAGPPRGQPNNLAIDVDAPGAVRAQVQVRIPELKAPLLYDLNSKDGRITGGIYVPAGKERLVSITAFGARGEPLYSGSSVATIDARLTREISIALGGKETGDPLFARLGTYRLDVGFGTKKGDGFLLKATMFDGAGNHIPFKPDDVKWQLPDGFEVLPYSCFLNSLCIDFYKPDLQTQAIYACIQDFTCWTHKPIDSRGPYLSVAVGLNHTCALTKDADIRCWGDNGQGQLGAPTAWCQNLTGYNCSLVPVQVVCPAGEVCKFRALAAGGNHTCAIDTNGKTWCWGEDGDWVTGQQTPNAFMGLPEHRQIPATANGVAVNFVSIDTSMHHTCALSSTQDLYCWGANTRGQLGYPQATNNGTPFAKQVVASKYSSVKLGGRHTCAIQPGFSGLMDCFGDDFDYQITGSLTFGTGQFRTVNPLIPLIGNHAVTMQAAGATNTCAQNSNADVICWGSPYTGSLAMTSGFLALHYAYATSIATELDLNGAAPGTTVGVGTRTCVTGQGGDLFCGNWTAGTPPLLTMIPDPVSDYSVIWNQVDVGPNHACAVTTQQDVWCWGLNTVGQFGTGAASATRAYEPVTAATRTL